MRASLWTRRRQPSSETSSTTRSPNSTIYSWSDSSPVGLSSTFLTIPASPGRRISSFETRTRSPTRKRVISELYNGASGGISLGFLIGSLESSSMVLMSSAAPGERYMGKKLYVGNLPFNTTDESLQEIFAQ